MVIHRLALALIAFTAVLAAAQPAEVPIPAHEGYIADGARVLDPERRARIKAKLQELPHVTGSQLGVMIVDRTDPETLEEFAQRAFTTWKLGRAKVDDGVLFVLAVNNTPRKMRIHTGYGLEGAIPDAVAKQILADQVRPVLESQGPAAAVEVAVDALLKRMYGADVPKKAQPHERSGGPGPDARVLVGSVMFLVLLIFSSALLTRRMRMGTFKAFQWIVALGGVALFVFMADFGPWAAAGLVFPAIAIAFHAQYRSLIGKKRARIHAEVQKALQAARRLKGSARRDAEEEARERLGGLDFNRAPGLLTGLPLAGGAAAAAMIPSMLEATPWTWAIGAGWGMATVFLGFQLTGTFCGGIRSGGGSSGTGDSSSGGGGGWGGDSGGSSGGDSGGGGGGDSGGGGSSE